MRKLYLKREGMCYKISSQCNRLSLWDSLSMMTGSVLQEDIVSTVGMLVRKGRDILGINPGSEMTRPKDENQTPALSATTANCAASV
jgi:hypothetical protein